MEELIKYIASAEEQYPKCAHVMNQSFSCTLYHSVINTDSDDMLSTLFSKDFYIWFYCFHNFSFTGNVFVSKYDEEYIMTFPNAYGRSILTVPWVELGGKTEITCPATGFNAQIEFLTKVWLLFLFLILTGLYDNSL